MMQKILNFALVSALVAVILSPVRLNSVSADSPITVAPPCNFMSSIAEINAGRTHWGGDNGVAIDIGGYEGMPVTDNSVPIPTQRCFGGDILAAITGTISYKSETFPCGSLGTITQDIMSITDSDGVAVDYRHQEYSYPYPSGSLVSVGSKIGTIGNIGCSTFPHIHFSVRRNNVNQNYSNWFFGNSSNTSQYGLIGMIDRNFRYSLSPNASTPSTLISDDIQSMSSWGNRAGFLYQNGTFKIKDGMGGGAVTISDNIRKFQLYKDRIGLLYQDGLLKIKDPTVTTTISTDISSFQIENNWIGLLYNNGALKVKNGLVGETITLTASAAKSFQIEGDNIGWVDTSDRLSRYNLLDKKNTVISTNVKSFQLEGDRIGLLRFDGTLVIKEGLTGVTSEQSTNIMKFALEGNRIGLLYTYGTFKVRDGLNGTVVTQSENIKEFKLRGDEIYMLYNNGDYKARRGMSGPVTLLGINVWII